MADYPTSIVVCNVELKRRRPATIQDAYWSVQIGGLLVSISIHDELWLGMTQVYNSNIPHFKGITSMGALNDVRQALEDSVSEYLKLEREARRNLETATRFWRLRSYAKGW